MDTTTMTDKHKKQKEDILGHLRTMVNISKPLLCSLLFLKQPLNDFIFQQLENMDKGKAQLCKQFFEQDDKKRGHLYSEKYNALIAHKHGENANFERELEIFLDIADKDNKGYVTIIDYILYRMDTSRK